MGKKAKEISGKGGKTYVVKCCYSVGRARTGRQHHLGWTGFFASGTLEQLFNPYRTHGFMILRIRIRITPTFHSHLKCSKINAGKIIIMLIFN